jgi:hypothetical protein
VAARGRPAARDGRAPASKRLGWGLESPSGDWRGWFGGKRLWGRSAAAAAVPASRRVDRPMLVHGSVQGVRVEAFAALELE